jgi:dTDP-4-dehydro-6-deoxy-alpha-D-glucopyranose 2,3-dehydratase
MRDVSQLLLRSMLKLTSRDGDIENILDWVEDQRNSIEVNITKKPLNLIQNWSYRDSIAHSSGGFFSIEGIRVESNFFGESYSWDQPIINQPEIGILGILTKEIDGVLHFLMQAKIEPGNINSVQISPTLQATKSNFSQLHGGKKPFYLDYFKEIGNSTIILDQLQSEQGSRFIKKRNRNMVIMVEDDIHIEESYKWLTLGQLNKLMQIDNVVNMDTRSIISSLTLSENRGKKAKNILNEYEGIDKSNFNNLIFNSMFFSNRGINSFERLLSFLTNIKSINELSVKRIALNDIKDWNISNNKIFRDDNKHFQIIGLNIEIVNREVTSWEQPILEPTQKGMCGLICKNFNGVLHFLIQAKLECGNYDLIEFGPTVQTLIDNDRLNIPYVEFIINSNEDAVIYNVNQSEEGGRFFCEQNQNIIIHAGEDFENITPETHIWMTLNQIKSFLVFNNFINIQLRSLISMLHIL